MPTQFSKKKRCRQFRIRRHFEGEFDYSSFKFKTNPKGVKQTIPNQIELASKNGVTPREGNDIIRINPSSDTVTLIKK